MENNTQDNSWYYKVFYFFIANQILLRRLIVVVLILLNIFVWWKGGIGLVNYLSATRKNDLIIQKMTEDYLNWDEIRLKNSPKDLQVLKVQKISTGENKLNLIAEIYNPNENWFAEEMDFSFTIDSFPIDWESAFVLPNTKRYLFKFSYENKNEDLGDLDLEIKNVNWSRVKKDVNYILNNISVQDKNFSLTQDYSKLDFTINNNSTFGWWQTGWQIVLFRGKNIVGVNYITVSGLLSGEQKKVSVLWDEKLISPDSVDVIPDINLFDESNYMSESSSSVNLIKGAKDSKQ